MSYENETYINDQDIWLTYNARLIHDSFTNLLLDSDAKEYTENNNRSQPGKQVFYDYPFTEARDVQLTFLIECNSMNDFLSKYKSMNDVLKNGLLLLKVIPLKTIFKIYRVSSMSLDSYSDGSTGILVVKFNEPNPEDRQSALITAYVLSSQSSVLTDESENLLTSNI